MAFIKDFIKSIFTFADGCGACPYDDFGAVLKPLFAANSEVQSGAAYVIALLVAVIAVGIVVRVLKLVDHIRC